MAVDRRAIRFGDRAENSAIGCGQFHNAASNLGVPIHRFRTSIIDGFSHCIAARLGLLEQLIDRHPFGGLDGNLWMLFAVLGKPDFEHFGDLSAICVAVLRILLHHLHADTIQLTWAIWTIRSDVGRHGVLVLDDTAGDAAIWERRMSGQQEVHRAPQTVNISAIVDRVAVESLFRSQIVRSSEDLVVVLHRQRRVPLVLE